jgi:RNA polymerase sigma-70 factor (ECF subfamily)
VDDSVPHPKPQLTDGSAATDAALMARVACGEPEALDPLYRRHRGLVYRFALLWSGSAATAADVTQDVFVHLLLRAGDYDAARGPLAPWLLGIARNFVRRRTGIAEVPLDDDGDVVLPQTIDEATPQSALALAQDLERLRRAIAALPPHYRDVLVLVELAERSYAEVAAICGCELNTVRSRLFRGRGLLARWLALDAGAADGQPAFANASRS